MYRLYSFTLQTCGYEVEKYCYSESKFYYICYQYIDKKRGIWGK